MDQNPVSSHWITGSSKKKIPLLINSLRLVLEGVNAVQCTQAQPLHPLSLPVAEIAPSKVSVFSTYLYNSTLLKNDTW